MTEVCVSYLSTPSNLVHFYLLLAACCEQLAFWSYSFQPLAGNVTLTNSVFKISSLFQTKGSPTAVQVYTKYMFPNLKGLPSNYRKASSQHDLWLNHNKSMHWPRRERSLGAFAQASQFQGSAQPLLGLLCCKNFVCHLNQKIIVIWTSMLISISNLIITAI